MSAYFGYELSIYSDYSCCKETEDRAYFDWVFNTVLKWERLRQQEKIMESDFSDEELKLISFLLELAERFFKIDPTKTPSCDRKILNQKKGQ